MTDTVQMTNISATRVDPPQVVAPSPSLTFNVAYLPKLGHKNFTPIQLATAIARCGFGKLVRADYAPCGIFAYSTCTSWRTALAVRGGTKIMTKSAHGPYTCIHLLPAHGWSKSGREGEPKVLTQGVNSYDIECPDAGKGSWENWERKVQVVEVSSDSEGFAELAPNPLVEMLRERRWPAEPAKPAECGKTVLVMTIEYEAERCGVCDTKIYEVPRDWVDDEDEGNWLYYTQDLYYDQEPDELPNSHRCWRRLHASHLNEVGLDDADREAIRKVWPEIPEEYQMQLSDKVLYHLNDGIDGKSCFADADFKGRPIFCIFKIQW